MSRNSLNNEIFDTPLTRLYFSPKNMEALQSAIQFRIYKKHNIRIDTQSETELIVIMRSIFFLDSKNLRDDIVGQIRMLNAKVIEFAVKQIMIQIKQYSAFQRDQNTLPTPMELPQNVSIKGERSLHTDGFI